MTNVSRYWRAANTNIESQRKDKSNIAQRFWRPSKVKYSQLILAKVKDLQPIVVSVKIFEIYKDEQFTTNHITNWRFLRVAKVNDWQSTII